jgi:hypothetical protein
MTYTVKYKLENQFFWRKINNVKGDFVVNDIVSNPRVFVLDDETRIEIPTKGTQVIFSKERFVVIKQNIEKENGKR